jgi:tripartite-type tricarboxylate transporter receptor subunit TctC
MRRSVLGGAMGGRLKAILAALLIAVPAAAPAAEDTRARLAGRTLDVVVAFSNTGGGARFWGIFAEALRRQLPDTVVRARFDDAGSGTSAAHDLFALSEGSLAVGFVRPAELAFAQAQAREDVDFDIGAARWIIGVERESHFMAARRDLPLDMDVLRASGPLVIPTNGITDTATIVATILDAVTGLHGRVVVGFGNADRLRAIIAGDGDFYTLSTDQEVSALLEAGEIRSLYVIAGDEFPPSVDRSRTVASVAVAGVPQAVIDYVVAARELGRSFYAPPGVVPEDVEALRTVFADAMRDPRLLAEAAAQDVPLDLVPGAEVQAIMEVLLLRDPVQRAAVEHAYECGRAMSDGTLDHCDFGP